MEVKEASVPYVVQQNPVCPKGYKQTEAGVIPESWGHKRVGDFATTVASGKSHVNSEFGDYPVYGSTGIIGQCSKADYSGTAVLIARVGANAGKLTVVNGEYGVTDNTIIVRIDESLHHNYFWRQLEAKRLNSMVFGSGQPLITGTQIKNLSIPLPPTKAEQQAIAEALSDADALIESLQQLLTKKRQLKQGAMQQLLTGKKRLPGFSGEWEMVKAGEIGRFRGGSGFPTKFQGVTSGEYPFFKVSDMNNEGNETFMETANNYISEVTRKQLGAVAFPANSIVFAKVGAAVFLERKKILARPSCLDNNMAGYVLDVVRTDCRFIHYVLLNTKLGDLVSTTALPSLSGNVLTSIEFALPSQQEQTAIATILADMDADIAALEQKLAKARAIKQGMMQELLTGRIRLVKHRE